MALLPSNRREQIMLFIGVLAIAGAALYWYYVWTPNDVRLAGVQTHLDSLESVNRRAKGELAKGSVQDLRAQAERYRAHLEVMRQLVPTGNEVPALLDQVSTAARRVGLDLGAVEPEPVIVGDQFDTYRYKMALFGNYHDVGEFLTNVGSLTRIIAPINLTLTPVQAGRGPKIRQKKGEQLVEVRFQIQTYVAKTTAPETERARPPRSGT